MKEKLKLQRYDKFMLILVFLVPLLNQLNDTGILKSDIIMYIPFVGMLVVFLFGGKKLNVNISIKIVMILLFLSFLVSPIIGLTIFNDKYTPLINIMYLGLYCIFTFSLIILASGVDKNKYLLYLKAALVGNSIWLVTNIVLNINEINSSNITSIFSRISTGGALDNSITRVFFGFSQPNTAAMYIVVEIIILYMIIKLEKKKKILITIAIIAFYICIIPTGSRTAFISISLFLVLELLFFIGKKINKNILMFIIFSIIIPVVIVTLMKLNIKEILNATSGRYSNIIDDLSVIKNDKDLIFGIASVRISQMSLLITNMNIIDNWYVMDIIRFGLIGLYLALVSVFVTFISLAKKVDKTALVLLIVLLVYSFAENVLFTPGDVISWLSWFVFFCTIQIKSKIL